MPRLAQISRLLSTNSYDRVRPVLSLQDLWTLHVSGIKQKNKGLYSCTMSTSLSRLGDKAKKRSVKEASFISEGELFGLDTSTENEDDDDSDWVQTPLYKRKFNNKTKHQPSISKCSCKGHCLRKYCGCRRQGTACSDFCKCGEQCKNKEEPVSTICKDDDSVSMTLNSTYNLEGKENVSVLNGSTNDFIEPVKPKQISSSHEFIEPNIAKRRSRRYGENEFSSSSEDGGGKKKRKVLDGSNSFFKPLA